MKATTGSRLMIRRIRAGLKQYEVAAEVGIAPCRLSEIEHGRRKADEELLLRIGRVLRDATKTKKDRSS